MSSSASKKEKNKNSYKGLGLTVSPRPWPKAELCHSPLDLLLLAQGDTWLKNIYQQATDTFQLEVFSEEGGKGRYLRFTAG